MVVVADFYTNGEYLQNNPDWHIDAGKWKAQSVLQIMARNGLTPLSVCEIGCGAGEILRLLQRNLAEDTTFVGYDIAPQAIELAKRRENEHLHVHLADFFQEADDTHYDVILLVDVLEHFENCFQALRDLKTRSTYKILQLPLDLSVNSILGNKLVDYRHATGHLHFFTKDIAIEILEAAGYTILDSFYSRQPLDSTSWSKARTPGQFIIKLLRMGKRELFRLPAQICYAFRPDLAVRIFGGWRLMVLVA
ncbi:class I SAM-dependent methyltransferase [Dictyobacter arantiisoli]|uniref:Uncharacterized protein n=1 Tax=Dictyobacter arantiisoli TaxID=2014874 RepID=A0A5A5T7U3_9CHLR|nr:class I SAM-dependent methyltransferase [Dictyobacter arantiisoli]GCF07531.1 hypothetical protein KDI_10950 [Dictyobacter arantiisoli]